MKLNVFVTLFLRTVLLLASAVQVLAQSQLTSNTKMPAPQNFHMKLAVARNTSLVDFHDGTRTDSMDYELTPSYKIAAGTFSAALTYTQDLRDKQNGDSDAGDIPLSFTLPGWKNKTYSVNYTLTALAPVSKKSVKRDELQTAISGKISLGYSQEDQQGLSWGAGFSLGQNFHSYEEDINGAILNKYSSNQTLLLGYALGDWSLAFTGINRTRMTYQNNVKSTFELIEEIEYAVNESIAFTLGHTNSGTPLKPNGVDSNVALVDEDTSTVYGSLTLNY